MLQQCAQLKTLHSLLHSLFVLQSNPIHSSCSNMDEQTRRKIEEAVIEILREADMGVMTGSKVLATASERLGFDLSGAEHKKFVSGVVDSYLLSMTDEIDGVPNVDEEPKEAVAQENAKPKEVDCNGERHICDLSGKRHVVVQDFKGKKYVAIREYYVRDGKRLPSTKGVNLSSEHWSTLKTNVSAIEEAIAKLQSKMRSKLGGELHPAVVSDPAASAAVENAPSDIAHLYSARSNLDGERHPAVVSDSTASTTRENAPNDIAHLDSTRCKLGGEQHPAVVSDPTASTTQENAPCGIAHLDSTSHPHGDQRTEKSNLLSLGSQEFVPIEITRFDGKNYLYWAAKMEMFLKQLDILYVLTDPCSVPSPRRSDLQNGEAKAFLQKRMHDDYLCRHNILNSLSDPLYRQFSKKAGNAKELWEELKSVYLYEEFGSSRSLVKQYLEFQIEEGKAVLEQVQELNGIADSLAAAEMLVPESFHVSAIIFKLPPSWRDFCVKLMHDKHLSFWVLMEHIRFEEDPRHEGRGETRNSRSFHAARNSGRMTADMQKPFNPRYKREPADTSKKGLVCDYCGKKGHVSKVCWDKKKAGKEMGENSNGGNLNTLFRATHC